MNIICKSQNALTFLCPYKTIKFVWPQVKTHGKVSKFSSYTQVDHMDGLVTIASFCKTLIRNSQGVRGNVADSPTNWLDFTSRAELQQMHSYSSLL